jgi:hypothetical protein
MRNCPPYHPLLIPLGCGRHLSYSVTRFRAGSSTAGSALICLRHNSHSFSLWLWGFDSSLFDHYLLLHGFKQFCFHGIFIHAAPLSKGVSLSLSLSSSFWVAGFFFLVAFRFRVSNSLVAISLSRSLFVISTA